MLELLISWVAATLLPLLSPLAWPCLTLSRRNQRLANEAGFVAVVALASHVIFAVLVLFTYAPLLTVTRMLLPDHEGDAATGLIGTLKGSADFLADHWWLIGSALLVVISLPVTWLLARRWKQEVQAAPPQIPGLSGPR